MNYNNIIFNVVVVIILMIGMFTLFKIPIIITFVAINVLSMIKETKDLIKHGKSYLPSAATDILIRGFTSLIIMLTFIIFNVHVG